MARSILKNARIEKGMTQADVAKKLNMTERAYQNYELGSTDGKPRIWDELEDLFGISQRELRKKEEKI